MNRCFPYCRHSTSLQETSTELQTAELRRYWKYKLEPQGIIWVDPHTDPAVSGKVPFLEREAGKALDHAAERGDHIICAKMDRGFRNARDFLLMYELWTQRGITLHLLDIQVDSSTPVGKMILTVVAAVAEWERKRINERSTAGYKLGQKKKLERGLPGTFHRAPLGFKWAGVRPNKRWVFCSVERAHMAQFLEWHRKGYDLLEIYVKAKNLKMYRRKDRATPNAMGWKVGMLAEWGGPLSTAERKSPGGPHTKGCAIYKAIKLEERLQAWEAEGRDEEWIARAMLVEALEKRAAKIELENERKLVAKALSTSYHGNGNGQSTNGELNG
jgi:DNA invertase Pin-like site-specific DNA recombinase